MCTEGPVAVMVLAMHVRRDHAADGDEPGPRHHWREPAARHKGLQEVREQYAGLAVEQAGPSVERLHPVHRQHRQGEL